MANNPAWLESAVFYQIYPQSFFDSNGDGIGDIPGIIRKLDYIRSLGVNAIWLNPCFESPFQDAGYDVSNFMKVAPRYGTNQNLYRLFSLAHDRGLRVCLDLVAGHTSIEHPWFKKSCKAERNELSDRYIWTNSVWDSGDGSIKFINGFAERDGNFATNFFYCQPALNYGFARPDPKCPWQQAVDAPGPKATRAALKEIMAFWLDAGCDGFRVDMASSLVKNDPGKVETIKLWQEFRAWLDKDYPHAALISEWSNPAEAIAAGFHVDFMIHFGVPGYIQLLLGSCDPSNPGECYFKPEGDADASVFLDNYLEQYRETKGKGFISIPSGNHDFPRIGYAHGRGLDDMKAIFAFLLTWPGVPFIYYGDEIGMRFMEGLASKEGGYSRTGTRTPMQWRKSRNAGFSDAPSSKLYLPVDTRKSRVLVDKQQREKGSLLNFVRTMIELRLRTRALHATGGELAMLHEPRGGKTPMVYMRGKGRGAVLVAVNPANRAQTVEIDGDGLGTLKPLAAGGVEVVGTGARRKVVARPSSYGVFEVA